MPKKSMRALRIRSVDHSKKLDEMGLVFPAGEGKE